MRTLYFRIMEQDAFGIVRDGLVDANGQNTSEINSLGVWFSDQGPMDGDLRVGDAVIAVDFDLTPEALAVFRWDGDQQGYMEWFIPTATVKATGSKRRICQ